MKPIKEIAGEILLYFYVLHRKNGFGSMDIIRFSGWDEITLPDQPGLSHDLLAICSGSAADLYNALKYLNEQHLLGIRISRDSGGDSMHNFELTAGGVDIIEGIERGQVERANFFVTFNIKLADNINVESLIKNELGSIFKGSLI
jgi:hypothetical protein